jgi:lysophospholipid acyltransferase (LPLAT)-like uncharacterized protein
MKFEHPSLLGFIGWSGARLLRCWMGTLRVRVHSEVPESDPRTTTRGYLYCLWHETLLMPTAVFANCGIQLLISQHRDGEYITRIVQHLGFAVVRGSTTRGAVRAVRELGRSASSSNLAITPDGPRGPRQVLQNGAVYLASRAGLAIVPMGFAFDRPWRAASWDRFVLPRPFTRAACYLGTPIPVPRDADAAELADHHRRVSDAMNRSASEAELLLAEPVSGGRRTRVHSGHRSGTPGASQSVASPARSAPPPGS